jgi:hypothetical protein
MVKSNGYSKNINWSHTPSDKTIASFRSVNSVTPRARFPRTLAASLNGLAEEELLGVLSADEQVVFRLRSTLRSLRQLTFTGGRMVKNSDRSICVHKRTPVARRSGSARLCVHASEGEVSGRMEPLDSFLLVLTIVITLCQIVI